MGCQILGLQALPHFRCYNPILSMQSFVQTVSDRNSSMIINPYAHLGTLKYLSRKTKDPSVQSLAGVLPQKVLQTKVEPGIDAGKYLQEMAKWKEWAEGQEGVKVFPVEPEAFQHYLTHVVAADLEKVTRAVTWVHQQANFPSPACSKFVQSSLDELQRKKGEGSYW